MKKLNEKETAEFYHFWNKKYRHNKHTRLGQSLYNAISDYDSEIAERIICTNADPFYDNKNILSFFRTILESQECWDIWNDLVLQEYDAEVWISSEE